MAFISDKWWSGTIFTKVATIAVSLSALFALICSIMFFAWGLGAGGFLYLIFAIFGALFAFGLFNVNRVARIAVIYVGLCILIPYVLLAALWIFSLIRFPLLGTLVSAYFEVLRAIVPNILSAVPGDIMALAIFLMVVFIGPLVLYVLSMLILFVFGADFKGEPKKKSKAVAYLLWFFFGFISAHKFYLEKDRTGIVFFLTCQVLWFGWYVNLFTLGKQVNAYNAKVNWEEAP